MIYSEFLKISNERLLHILQIQIIIFVDEFEILRNFSLIDNQILLILNNNQETQ